MTADILTLDDFRHDDAGRARISASECEPHAHPLGLALFVTLPDPLPKDWSQFWKASEFWWRPRPVTTIPSAESWRRALMALQSKVSTFVN